MTTSAAVVADSLAPDGSRLTTLALVLPKVFLAELNTHRAFSRNASSSRAIPVARLIETVERDPYVPIAWRRNRPGMRAGELLEPGQAFEATRAWLCGLHDAVAAARRLAAAGVHKEHANRVLEPYAHARVVVTATEWGNFFALRDHDAAQPEMRDLARAMRRAMDGSTPLRLRPDDWHTPYVSSIEGDVATRRRLSAARCARVSYRTHDGEAPKPAADMALAERLLADSHMSPFEHQATPVPGRHANFAGWRSWRAGIEAETETETRAVFAEAAA